MSENTFPGDKIAQIEEFEAGNNAYDNGDMVFAAVIGKKNIDKESRTISISHKKQLSIPQVGYIVIGTVVAVMSSMIAVSIEYINGKKTVSNVECICSTRNIRRKNVALVNDIIKLKIIGHLNGTIHAAMDDPSLGLLCTKCRNCGGDVVQMRDAIKCIECSWIDERKLSTDFGNSDFIKLEE